MPLDKPIVDVFVHTHDGEEPVKKHWVGARGEWIAFVRVDEKANWYIQNVRTGHKLDLPPLDNVDIYPTGVGWGSPHSVTTISMLTSSC